MSEASLEYDDIMTGYGDGHNTNGRINDGFGDTINPSYGTISEGYGDTDTTCVEINDGFGDKTTFNAVGKTAWKGLSNNSRQLEATNGDYLDF